MFALPTPLISVATLSAALSEASVKIIDASWHMPAANRDARAEYQERHIPSAQFFDIDATSDHSTDLPHMLPDAEDFAATISAMGISNADHVVVYDAAGLFSAARLWWMFRVFGHEKISVLDGGLPAWIAAGKSTQSEAAEIKPAVFRATLQPSLLRSRAEILANLEPQHYQVIDARGKPRFDGTAPEPRAGLRSGHIPYSLNIPFTETLNADGSMKDAETLRAVFAQAKWTPEKPTIASCGSGVTACILALALARMGYPDTAIYDGSWAEWGGHADCPVATR